MAVLVSTLPAWAWAQESVAPPARAAAIDFWCDGPAKGRTEAPSSARELSGDSLWMEPFLLPDGRMAGRLPPRPVLALLDAPTEATARAYMAWQEERAKRLKDAQEVLSRLHTEGGKDGASRPAGAVEVENPKTADPGALRAIYFFDPADAVAAGDLGTVEAFARRNSDVAVLGATTADEGILARFRERVAAGGLEATFALSARRVDLFERFGVETTPAVLVVNDRTRDAVLVRRPFGPADLDAAVEQLRAPAQPAANGDQPRRMP